MAKEPLGVRYNNPGCIKPGVRSGLPVNKAGYRIYESEEEGFYDLATKLQRNYNHKTAYDIFRVYAPSSDGNNPRRYAANVIAGLRAEGFKVTENTKLDMDDPVMLAAVMRQISICECGYKNNNKNTPYWSKEFIEQVTQNYCNGKSVDYAIASSAKLRDGKYVPREIKATEMPLVKSYYNGVRRAGYLGDAAPQRRKEASKGIIAEDNVPRARDPFNKLVFSAYAKTETSVIKNGSLPREQQVEKAIAEAGMALGDELKKGNPKAIAAMETIAREASREIYIRQNGNKALSMEQEDALAEQTGAMLASLKTSPEVFLAKCDNILTKGGNFGTEKTALAQSGSNQQTNQQATQTESKTSGMTLTDATNTLFTPTSGLKQKLGGAGFALNIGMTGTEVIDYPNLGIGNTRG